MVTSSIKMNGARSLPVFLMNVNEKIHVGAVSFHPSQSVKKLQFAISQEIGVAPYQINSYLARDKQPQFRIPINEKNDLSVVSREIGDWHVLAVFRPANGKNRRRRTRATENPKPEQPEKILLRRNRKDSVSHVPVVQHLMLEPDIPSAWDLYYRAQIWNLQRERERYLMETTWTPSQSAGEMLGQDTWRDPEPCKTVCGVCERAADLGAEAGFHRCVKDEVVTVGPTFFRSRVGPIERPSKNRVEGIIA